MQSLRRHCLKRLSLKSLKVTQPLEPLRGAFVLLTSIIEGDKAMHSV